jgi:hypothetical protein
MKIKSKIGQALAMATVLGSVATVGLISGGTASADLGTGNTISVNSGNNGTTFSLNVVAPSNACQGDTATGGYRFHQYITTADPATLGFAAGAITAPGGAFVQPLYSTTGSPQINKATAINTGQLIGLSTLNFNTNTLPGNGVYNIGFICVLAGATTRHWVTPITVSGFVAPSTFNWQFGAVPAAPVLASPLTSGDGTLSGSFTGTPSTPGTTGFTVTATPTVGAPVTLNVATPGAFTLTGLTNGTSYAVSVVATNTVGNSAASNTVTATPAPGIIAAPVVTATSGVGQVLLSWTTPSAPPAAVLTGYTVTASPAVAGSPFSIAAGTNTLTVTAAPGAYSFTVQALYAAPYVGAVSAPATASSNNAQVLVQNLTVVRPAGALVLTQRCGVHGSTEAYSDTTFGSLPLIPATPGADPALVAGVLDAPTGVGTAPIIDTDPVTAGVQPGPDPRFAQYPYPVDAAGIPNPNYPTNCAIDLGTGQLITSGPRAGQYFKATGRIAQITVVNTRDADSGWTLNGRMSTFTSTTDATETFSGNLLGWDPEVTWDSNPNLDGYDMVVLKGDPRQPQQSSSTTGLGAASNETNTARASSLAQSDATPALNADDASTSLGMAVIDARLRLLIPVTADAGTYTGTLTFTTV